MAVLVLGLDDGQHFELPYTFGESRDTDDAVRLALKLFADQIVYSKIEQETEESDSYLDFDAGELNLRDTERRLVIIALERSGWCQKEAAALLGISYRQMSTKIDRHRINPPVRAGWRKAR
jgi:transcriptional regulator with GAF, ATPase, and Fis domain